MVDMWSILAKIHRKSKITSATSETRETIQTTSMNQIANQQANTDGFGQCNDNDECMKQLRQIELDMVHQTVVL